MNPPDCLFSFKIMLLGGDNVGKSCILRRYTEGSLPERVWATIGVDLRTHFLEVEPGVKVKLQIWDTVGLERYWPTTCLYLPKTHGFPMVFDMGDPDSLRHVEYLYEQVSETLQSGSARFVLVGHKCDLYKSEDVRERAEMLAGKWNAPYYEVSAKTGHNVLEIFELLARRIYQGLLWDL